MISPAAIRRNVEGSGTIALVASTMNKPPSRSLSKILSNPSNGYTPQLPSNPLTEPGNVSNTPTMARDSMDH